MDDEGVGWRFALHLCCCCSPLGRFRSRVSMTEVIRACSEIVRLAGVQHACPFLV